ncbi:MAG TPA: DUF4410 domain-containing protein [Verrucomicrobiae bacterium]
MKTIALLAPLVALAVVCGPGCKSAKVVAERDYGKAVVPKPSIVYVADFEIWAQNIKTEQGLLSGRSGPVGTITTRFTGKSSDPAVRARQMVELMANSLLKELSKAGFRAMRIPPGVSFPAEGWLLRGLFTQVDEGNRLRRSMIGFGEGQTDVQVVANVQDLSKGPPKPVYEIATDATSGDTPGAAPTLVLGPYGAAARFVMAGKDLDKNVKQTAARIAERMAKRVQEPK